MSSSLPSPTHFSVLVNAATDTLCSTLTSCLDNIFPLSSRQHVLPLLSVRTPVSREKMEKIHQQIKIKAKDLSDLIIYQSLLSSYFAEVHTAEASYFHNKINSASDTRNCFKTFNSLLCPPPPPPP